MLVDKDLITVWKKKKKKKKKIGATVTKDEFVLSLCLSATERIQTKETPGDK